VDCNSLIIIVSMVVFCLLSSFVSKEFAVFNFYGQFFFVHMQLMVIVGLTLDGGTSVLSKICNWKPIQELGKASLTLYLIHEPVMDWLKIAAYGIVDCSDKEWELWKAIKKNETTEFVNLNYTTEFVNLNKTTELINLNETNPTCELYEQKEIFPLWGIPLIIVLCPLLAWLITVIIEEPARNWLRVKNETK